MVQVAQKKVWKSKLLAVCVLAVSVVVILYYQPFQDEPALKSIDFLFIFIAIVILSRLAISHQRPGLSRYVLSFQNRAPPLQ
jgi:hypothetical protein